jgi:hypothetical protein
MYVVFSRELEFLGLVIEPSDDRAALPNHPSSNVSPIRERWRDIKYWQKTGRITVTRKFGDIAKIAKRELLEDYERTDRDGLLDYAQVIDKYLIPLPGKCHCLLICV